MADGLTTAFMRRVAKIFIAATRRKLSTVPQRYLGTLIPEMVARIIHEGS